MTLAADSRTSQQPGYDVAAYRFALRELRVQSPADLADLAVATLEQELACTSATVFVEGDLGFHAARGRRWDAATLQTAVELLARAPQAVATGLRPLLRIPDQRESALEAPADLVELMESEGIDALWSLPCPAEPPGVLLLSGGPADGAFHGEDADFVAVIARRLACLIAEDRRTCRTARLESLLAESDRLASIGNMTAGLAHEIRNPLVSIRTFTQLLPERYNDDEFRSSFLDLTLSEIDRICDLVSELLAYARPQDHDPGMGIELDDCVARTCLLMRSQAKTSAVDLEYAGGCAQRSVAFDEDRLKQVVMNLINNAVQACDGGGLVTVSTHNDGESLRLEVRDNGPGMTAEVAERAFDPYFTTRKAGTGLGLAIVKTMIEECGGQVSLHRSSEGGTLVCLRFPIARGQDADSTDEGADSLA